MSEQPLVKDRATYLRRIKDARIGDPAAQYEVALMYANGIGVKKSVDEALTWTRAAATKGHVAAQYMLGCAYLGGLGVEKDEQEALRWFSKAIEQGNDKAAVKLARLFEGAHATLAFKAYLKAAEQGLAEAQMALGDYYAAGDGVPQDQQAAIEWYYKAAEQGHAPAQFALGHICEQGIGVDVDLETAAMWYEKAADLGMPTARVALERTAPTTDAPETIPGERKPGARERREEEQPWIRFAEKGGPQDRYCLGLMYELGLGISKSIKQAKVWYLKAAEQESLPAQLALARLLETSDIEQAVFWYHKAAEHGNADAQMAMGTFYAQGRGVVADPLKSLSWYVRASEQGLAQAHFLLATALQEQGKNVSMLSVALAAKEGIPEAQYAMGQRYALGQDVAQNYQEACRWYLLAANQEHAEAQCTLGDYHIEGKGVRVDRKHAFLWYERAAEQGVARAQWNLGELYATGVDGIPADTKQAMLLCKKAANAGFAPAQATLGTLFAQAKKYERSLHWWGLAAEQDDLEALFNLANAYRFGKGVPKDEKKSFLLLMRAAEKGLAAAQARVGLAYATGTGVAEDLIEAAKWFMLAAAQGEPSAIANRERAQTSMHPAQLEEAARRAEQWSGTISKIT
ncbi:MAG: SEL1-like repeat protein [Rhodoferax sp.]|nr:SEL1-like repeat protein [Rhodoferax sp.]